VENLEPRICLSPPPHTTDHDITVTGQSFTMVQNASSNATVASFTDADGDTNPGDYSATITWGDSTGSSGGSVSYDGVSTFHVGGTHTYTSTGNFSVGISVTDNADGYGNSGSTTGTAVKPTLHFSSSSSSVSETAGNALVTVILDTAVNMAVTVNYATSNATRALACSTTGPAITTRRPAAGPARIHSAWPWIVTRTGM